MIAINRSIPKTICFFVFILFFNRIVAQSISSELPTKIDPSQKFLFYFHGGVVSVLGDNAINQGAPEWGPYQYSAILDSLKSRGFNVISEIRHQSIPDSVFIKKFVIQMQKLITANVPRKNIICVGASAGNDIIFHGAALLSDKRVRYVVMGGCWKDTYKSYESLDIKGKFLSIIEKSDPHGTCVSIFSKRKNTTFKELTLNTGLSHGFLYRGHKAWVDPVVNWFNTER